MPAYSTVEFWGENREVCSAALVAVVAAPLLYGALALLSDFTWPVLLLLAGWGALVVLVVAVCCFAHDGCPLSRYCRSDEVASRDVGYAWQAERLVSSDLHRPLLEA